jgi:two-component system, chemotaxis family, protein-glutamate methylesterase/glutaminase
MSTVVKVLVVDDSAFVRKVVREMLTRSPGIEVVGVARDGDEALEAVEQLKPDVVTCDLTMPRAGGVEFVRKQMPRRPLPILILTASSQDAAGVMDALAAGAVDFVQKPTALATDQLLEISSELVTKIRGAAGIPVQALAPPTSPIPGPSAPTFSSPAALKADIVVLGISTGGPQALRQLLPRFPANFPVPIAIVLHMPIGYTAAFAEKLNEISALRVKEARDGDLLEPGVVLLAPAGRHLNVRRTAAGQVVAHLSVFPIEKLHRPSADVLFQSAAEVYNRRVLGVVMTGMGDDGTQGSAWIKAQGGSVLTEAEKSCVIYGMPRSVVEAGLSDAAVPLDRMAEEIFQRL